MTPKEKSIELLKKVRISLTEKANKDDMLWEMTVHYQTIDIVLLMVNELINTAIWCGDIDNEIEENSKEYWQEVKEELTVLVSIP